MLGRVGAGGGEGEVEVGLAGIGGRAWQADPREQQEGGVGGVGKCWWGRAVLLGKPTGQPAMPVLSSPQTQKSLSQILSMSVALSAK